MTNIGGMLCSAAGDSEPYRAARSLRIVIADDDPDTTRTLAMLLRDEGHEVRGVLSGRHVMAAVIELEPDVVVLDINLPEVSGWQLASTIRGRRPKKLPLLIGISGEFTADADRRLAHTSGFDHYLLKPSALEDLLKLLAPLTDPTRNQ
jgi:DNA-binding response OmpR family regulator